ncbi:tetratricopeptide repeat protein [Streptomyces sp. NPDC051554]|uniref:tetratricopeptide repeat protein n=1 Tax=Streptomyces sp. NPDC051554 TaxID=3365656 RepID=UPI0037BAFE0A
MSDTDNRPNNGNHDHVDFSDSENHGPVQGKGTQNNYFGISRVPAKLPHQVGVIPSRAGCFQDRAEAARLGATLAGGGTTVVNSAGGMLTGGVLAGMGGVGKTQLAANYARTAWQAEELDVVVWITANNSTAAASGYAQAGIEILGADPANPQQATQAFLAWLEPKPQERPCRWLVVLDDLTDPADLNGLWPPASPHGRTLVTTRRKDAALTGNGRQLIEVGLFTHNESIAYLATTLAAHHRHEPDTHLASLADDLGHLPLALAQAAAYLIDTGETVDAYRHLLADRTTKLTDAAPDVLPDDQALPLAAAWSLSIDRADTLRPAGLARPMLQIAAFLDANGIPQDVLTSSPALAHLTAHRTRTGPDTAGEGAPVSPQEAVRTLRALHRLSLVDHSTDTPHEAVRVHQLIQRATRDTLTPHQHDQTTHSAADALMAAWPAIARDTALAQTLRANATALAGHGGEALYQPDAHTVLYRTGTNLGETGQVTAACKHYQRLTETTRRHLGEDHPDTLTARNNLARWRGEAGNAAEAAQAYTDLLADRIRVLGEDHPDTLATRGHLARWRGEAGNATEAAQAFADLLKHMVRVLGEDHPHTLTARSNLAHWRGETGNATEAAQAYTDLLADRTRVQGEDHPDTLATRSNLARWRGEAGNATEAAQAYTDLLKHMVRVLGEDHPHTLTTRGNLAHWQKAAAKAPTGLGNDRS